MDKVSVNPKNIRCLGNIVSPKTASDFGVCNGTIATGTDTVNSQSMTVYTTDYLTGSNLTVEYTGYVNPSTSSFSVKCTLKDSSNNAISGATVYLEVNGTTYALTTPGSGAGTFWVPTNGSTKYTFKAYYKGENDE